MAFIKQFIDKILLSMAGCIFLFALVVWIIDLRESHLIIKEGVTLTLGGNVYEPSEVRSPRILTQTWEKAPHQKRGEKWLYDVFTPPVIYYNPVTLRFTVTPPDFRRPVVLTEDPFEVELLDVRARPYRMQLVGYLGEEGDYVATFEYVPTGGTLVGRPGKRFSQAHVTLRSFEVEKKTSTIGNMPIVESIAKAVLFDEDSGEEILLTNKERRMLSGAEAVFRIKGNSIIEYTYTEGGLILNGEQTYSINRLQVFPPRATLILTSPDLADPLVRSISPVNRGSFDTEEDDFYAP
ncbi:MAG: hypothetical protein JKY51_03705 [Opitutaceae bacterium]|nr:hypothetical protein [Opitutaceae bacterium]